MLLLLLGTILMCRSCSGALLDHGPPDPVLTWPQWYRDTASPTQVLGLCRSTARNAAGATLCFPIVPTAGAFAGNVGDEIFYWNMNVNVQSGAIDLRYVAALEAAYGTANPAGAPVKGQEVVFSRVRFVMSVTAGQGCAGNYTIVHPYGSESFPSVPEGKRALVVTLDKPAGAIGDFDGALEGDVGPFLRWDTEFPVVVGGERFIGDPNTPHTYTGSPFGTNYVEVQGPAGCNVDGGGRNVARVTVGLLLGQIWTTPIPTPATVVSAVYSRTGAAANIVDVEAKAATGNKLVVAGPQGFPSTVMVEDKDASGKGTSKFHAHIEYTGNLPASIRVINLNSNPVVASEGPLVDVVQISVAEFNPATSTLCVHARSYDEGPVPTLALLQPSGGIFPPTPVGCTPAPGFLCLCVPLPNSAPKVTSQSASVLVESSHGGKGLAMVRYLTGKPNNPPIVATARPDVFNVSSSGATTLAVGANDQFTAPVTFLLVIPLPAGVGTVAAAPAPAAPGTMVFTAAAGAVAQVAEFSYIIQQGTSYSNIAKVTLTLQDTVQAPVTVPDTFVVRTGTTKVLDVLANDTPVRGTTINKASLKVDTTGTRGTVTVAPTGLITYKAPVAGGVDLFKYTVNGSPAAPVPSLPTQVSINVPTAQENLAFSRTRFTASKGRWVINANELAAGWTGSVTANGVTLTLNTLLQCYVRQGAAPFTWAFIGSAPFGTLAPPEAVIDTNAGDPVTLPNGAQGTVPGCANAGQSCIIQCATNNVVSPFPSAAAVAAGATDRREATVTAR